MGIEIRIFWSPLTAPDLQNFTKRENDGWIAARSPGGSGFPAG
jgi:hypothetical protein